MASKKGISNWKQKKTFEVLAPENFNSKSLGITLALDEKTLIGRKIITTLRDLSDDRSKQHLKLKFEIVKVSGSNAITKFNSFKIAPGYIRSRTRRGMKKVDYIIDVKLCDISARVKTMILAEKSMSRAQKMQMGKKIREIFQKHSSMTLDQFVQLTLFGKLGTELYHGVKNICKTSRVEVYEIKTL